MTSNSFFGTFDSGADALYDLSNHLKRRGEKVRVRGQNTYELRHASIFIEDPTDVLSTGMNRKMNVALGYAEGLQLIGGFSAPERLAKIAPNMTQFQDGGYFHGAYGPRAKMQFPRIVERLKHDPTSRQAVVTLWDPLHDLMYDGAKDYPCTIGFTFSVRNGALEMSTHMRSNDIWWGWTYDVVQFCMLQLTMAHVLGYEVGKYHHYVDSLHLYERDIDEVKALDVPGNRAERVLISHVPGLTWESVADNAKTLFFHKNHDFTTKFPMRVSEVINRAAS